MCIVEKVFLIRSNTATGDKAIRQALNEKLTKQEKCIFLVTKLEDDPLTMRIEFTNMMKFGFKKGGAGAFSGITEKRVIAKIRKNLRDKGALSKDYTVRVEDCKKQA